MSKTAIIAVVLFAALAACAKKQPEVAYVDQPVTQEPVYKGKYGN